MFSFSIWEIMWTVLICAVTLAIGTCVQKQDRARINSFFHGQH